MKNIVIAAGYATRLGELTKNFPKPLLKIGESTILGRMLDDIDTIPEVDEHIIITNHKFASIFEEWAAGRVSPETSLRDPSHRQAGGPLPLTRPRVATDSAMSVSSGTSTSTASSRINVADTSALGLPEAVIRIACSKGTYIRAFARDLGEALGSGAHLSGLIRSRSGSFRIEDALSLDQALSLLQ